jgi:uncharacterized membrane protein YphA (DoxX/SURF4 family)
MDKLKLGLRIIAAGILFQTLFFKFTGAPESIYIFTKMGIEPWGRWFSGVTELVAGILLLLPATQGVGAVLAIGVMGGAILSHLAILACTVLVCSVGVAWMERARLLEILRRVQSSLGGVREPRKS